MKLYELLNEGIPMGAKELSSPPKKDYTIGFEFELSVDAKDSVDEETMESLNPSSPYFDVDIAWDTFSESDTFTFDLEEWFDNTFIEDTKPDEIAREYSYEPRYGYPDEDDVTPIVKFLENERLEEQQSYALSEDETNVAKALLSSFDDVYDLDDDELIDFIAKNKKLVKDLFKFYMTTIRRDEPSSIENFDRHWETVDFTTSGSLYNVRRIIHMLRRSVGPIKVDPQTVLNEYDFYEYIYADKNQTKLIRTNDEVTDWNSFIKYFDVDTYELRNDLTMLPEYQNAYNEAEQTAFNDWLNSMSSTSGVRDYGALRFVKQLLKQSPKTRSWSVVPDGTHGVDAEIVTNVMGLDEGLDALRDTLRMISRENNLSTSSATGLHVNIGTWRGDEYKKVDWLKFLLVFNPAMALKEFGRAMNSYAIDKTRAIFAGLGANDLNPLYSDFDAINQSVIASCDKYSAINLKKLLGSPGYIEIRAMGNAGYEENADRIIMYIQRVIRALEVAADPSAYRREYIKKLYSVMMRQMEGNLDEESSDIHQYFAKQRTPYYYSDPLESLYAFLSKGIPPAGYNIRANRQLVTDINEVKNINPDLHVGNKLVDMLHSIPVNGQTLSSIYNSDIVRFLLRQYPSDPDYTANPYRRDWY